MRGLKSIVDSNCLTKILSHLTRGAWIEIYRFFGLSHKKLVAPHTRCVDWNNNNGTFQKTYLCRTSHEVRGLKFLNPKWLLQLIRRTSHEVRGLKSLKPLWGAYIIKSHLTRGAWIEISFTCSCGISSPVAPHTRCVDWNCHCCPLYLSTLASHLTRGAWIEIINLIGQ